MERCNVMEKNIVLRYLLFAQRNNKVLKIITSKEKEIKVKIIGYENGLVKYKFSNSEKISAIRFENIISTNFEKEEDEKEFMYQNLSKKYDTFKLEETIKSFEKYYLEIIETLLNREKKGSIGYVNLNNKKKIYPQIFNNLHKDEENLLFYYFTKKQLSSINRNSITENSKKEILLIEQANLSQKKALDNALNERISIIEGPPGTGKTTTIINILANLMYQNKKVLVVSKNNSAIENVAEELTTMNIPKCYIRMRKF